MTNDTLAMLIGGFVGLMGVGAAVFAILWGLGLAEYMGGKKKLPVASISPDQLRQKLLAINSPELPYVIKPVNETDLELEWQIADARWFAVFGKERLRKTYRAFMVIDALRRSVRYCEEMVTVNWIANVDGTAKPALSYKKEFFRGRILFQKSWEVGVGIKEDLTIGKVYEYKFDIGYIRNPIKKAVKESGWEFVPVVNKNHATYKSLKM